MAEVISKEVAVAEVQRWLDSKKVRQSKRDDNKAYVDQLVSAICDGLIVINDDNTITQEFLFPIEDKEGNPAFKSFKYKSRIPVKLLHIQLQGIKATDQDARLLAHVSALTGQSKAIVSNLDTEDYGIATSIAVFFA